MGARVCCVSISNAIALTEALQQVPQTSIESIIINIMADMVAVRVYFQTHARTFALTQEPTQGNGRVDFHKKGDYTEAEARAAYERVKREHGWK